MHTFPADIKQGDTPSSCLRTCAINGCPLGLRSVPCIFAFVCFLLVTLLLKMTPKGSAKVLSTVPDTEVCEITQGRNLCGR